MEARNDSIDFESPLYDEDLIKITTEIVLHFINEWEVIIRVPLIAFTHKLRHIEHIAIEYDMCKVSRWKLDDMFIVHQQCNKIL